MACPYFVPREMLNDGSWPHPARLPLGSGWSGHCCASGQEFAPAASALREYCNLGNANACPHLPAEREWDAIRFSVACFSSEQITLCFVCERGHVPAAHGKLVFDLIGRIWRTAHPDLRVQRLADCFLEAWQVRQVPIAV